MADRAAMVKKSGSWYDTTVYILPGFRYGHVAKGSLSLISGYKASFGTMIKQRLNSAQLLMPEDLDAKRC